LLIVANSFRLLLIKIVASSCRLLLIALIDNPRQPSIATASLRQRLAGINTLEGCYPETSVLPRYFLAFRPFFVCPGALLSFLALAFRAFFPRVSRGHI